MAIQPDNPKFQFQFCDFTDVWLQAGYITHINLSVFPHFPGGIIEPVYKITTKISEITDTDVQYISNMQA